MIVSKSMLCADLPHHVGQCISLKCIIHYKYVYYAPEFQHEIPKIAIFYRKTTFSKKHHSLLVSIVVSTQFLVNKKTHISRAIKSLKLHGLGLSKSLTDSSSSSLYLYIPRTQMTLVFDWKRPCFWRVDLQKIIGHWGSRYTNKYIFGSKLPVARYIR